MKVSFHQNNDMLVWNLLYGQSVSLKVHAIKQKLWLTYKKEYQAIKNDKDEILKDMKNFIPDDNTLYDLLLDTKVFEKLTIEVEKHRISLMKIWDQYKRKINLELQDILRLALPDIKVIVLYPAMDTSLKKEGTPNIAWGKKNDLEDPLYTMLDIIKTSATTTIDYKDEEDEQIANAVLELAILNECYTRVDRSNYLKGTKNLIKLKKEIYPYFLMYLGYNLEETTECMMRDNLPFEMEQYTNEAKLRTFNIFEFIDYLVRNKKYMLKMNKETVKETVEIL